MQVSKHLKTIKLEAEATWKQHVDNAISSDLAEMRFCEASPDDRLQAGKWGMIHESHIRMMVKSTVFCRRCGLWSTIKCLALRQPCSGQPRPHGGQSRLKRMLGGHHPDKAVREWPDGTSTFESCKGVRLDAG